MPLPKRNFMRDEIEKQKAEIAKDLRDILVTLEDPSQPLGKDFREGMIKEVKNALQALRARDN